MIYTVTFNPSIDYVVRMDSKLEPGKTNRSSSEDYFIGGKGNNVSVILNELHTPNTALGFAAGFTGREIVRALGERGIKTDYIFLSSGNSRINIKLKGKNNRETEINAAGPFISEKELDKLFRKLDALNNGDYLVLAGSIPKSLKSTVYEEIIERLKDKEIRFIVDAGGELLRRVLKYKPFLIKPNKQELEELFDTKISSSKDIAKYAEALKKEGARNVIVSLGGDGAILFSEDGREISLPAMDGEVKNTVGAGDSMVAGFIAGFVRYNDYGKAFKLGCAAGSATAFSDDLAGGELIESLFEKLQ